MKPYAVFVLLVLLASGCRSGDTPVADVGEPSPCAGLKDIKAMPFRAGEMGGDRAYYAIHRQGDKATACLIEAVKSDRPMSDPGEGPKIQGFREGDLAFLLLMELGKVSYEQCAPPDVMRRFESIGVQAFFNWVHAGNRHALYRCAKGIPLSERAALPEPQPT